MRTKEEMTKYMREYRAKNREKVNKYNKGWMQDHRGGVSRPKKVKKPPIKSKAKCEGCGILLGSEFAGKHKGGYCEDCL